MPGQVLGAVFQIFIQLSSGGCASFFDFVAGEQSLAVPLLQRCILGFLDRDVRQVAGSAASVSSKAEEVLILPALASAFAVANATTTPGAAK
ncbi:hypothetical protein [Microbacterium lacticum]